MDVRSLGGRWGLTVDAIWVFTWGFPDFGTWESFLGSCLWIWALNHGDGDAMIKWRPIRYDNPTCFKGNGAKRSPCTFSFHVTTKGAFPVVQWSATDEKPRKSVVFQKLIDGGHAYDVPEFIYVKNMTNAILKFEVKNSESGREIETFNLPLAVKADGKWHSRTVQGANDSILTFKVKATCKAHFFGDNCDRSCLARDDDGGHYKCQPDGSKKCRDGWKDPETDCKTPEEPPDSGVVKVLRGPELPQVGSLGEPETTTSRHSATDYLLLVLIFLLVAFLATYCYKSFVWPKKLCAKIIGMIWPKKAGDALENGGHRGKSVQTPLLHEDQPPDRPAPDAPEQHVAEPENGGHDRSDVSDEEPLLEDRPADTDHPPSCPEHDGLRGDQPRGHDSDFNSINDHILGDGKKGGQGVVGACGGDDEQPSTSRRAGERDRRFYSGDSSAGGRHEEIVSLDEQIRFEEGGPEDDPRTGRFTDTAL